MTSVTILHQAEAELSEAVEYYENQQTGLGADFAGEAQSSIESIQHFPERWPMRDDGTRRYLLQRFPYIVVYIYWKDHIWVIAFAHCKRQPGYWSQRTPRAGTS